MRGALDRDKRLAVSQFTAMIADADDARALADHTLVLSGHANTNDELVAAARQQIAELAGHE